MDYYGHDLRNKPLYIAEGEEVGEIATSTRIGIQNSGERCIIHGGFMRREMCLCRNLLNKRLYSI